MKYAPQNLAKNEDLLPNYNEHLGFSGIQDPSLAHILYSIPSSVYMYVPHFQGIVSM